jgi:predicted metalloprotease with PDZ domain
VIAPTTPKEKGDSTMRSKLLIGTTLLLVLIAAPVLAGSECGSKSAEAAKVAKKSHNCTADTQICLNKMAAKMADKGWVGVELDDSDGSGALTIVRVEPDSPALAAGLHKGDVLLAVNGVKFGSEDKEAWHAVKSEMQVGNTITYVVARDGYKKKVDVTLAEVPEAVMARWVGSHMLQHATIELAQNN